MSLLSVCKSGEGQSVPSTGEQLLGQYVSSQLMLLRSILMTRWFSLVGLELAFLAKFSPFEDGVKGREELRPLCFNSLFCRSTDILRVWRLWFEFSEELMSRRLEFIKLFPASFRFLWPFLPHVGSLDSVSEPPEPECPSSREEFFVGMDFEERNAVLARSFLELG